MKLLKGFIFMITFMFGFGFSGNTQVYAANPFPTLETQIHSGANAKKIRKMQFALKEFGIYDGEIDGNFKSVEKDFLDYQKRVGLIKNNNDYGAGYFGVQTLKSLRENYPDKFDEVTKKYLEMDKPATHARYFYITAYYSPVPGQKRYTTGSYRGDIRLNGEGKLTASKKKVFAGVLAAPRNYVYGTKIEFEGLGIGVVEDRGGAIVNSGERGYEYDRIDIWMGYGDEGLRRALKWGKRKVKGKIVPDLREVSIEFDESPVIKYAKLTVDGDNPKTQNVVKLQKLLKEVKIYKGPIDGKYVSVKDDFIKYQVENNVVSSKNSPSAGFFGARTYAALRKDFGGGIFKKKDNKLDEDVVLSSEVKKGLEKVKDKISLIIKKRYGSSDSSLAMKYRKDLRTVLDIHANKTKNKMKKKKLKYLKSII